MLERWQRMATLGLRGDPMGAVVPHRLHSVRFGPICLRSCGEKPGVHKHSIAVRVGLATRAAVAKHTVSWWHNHTATLMDSSEVVEIAMPATAPVWNEHDGLLILHIRLNVQAPQRPFGCSKSRNTWKKLRVWWRQAYLAACPDDLKERRRFVLEVHKAWIDGVHRDLEDHEIVPVDFKIAATFENEAAMTSYYETIFEEEGAAGCKEEVALGAETSCRISL